MIDENQASEELQQPQDAMTEEQMLQLFIGDNYHRFKRYYDYEIDLERAKKDGTHKPRMPISINWMAFFFTPVWFFYRKLYLYAAAILLLPIVLFSVFPELSDVGMTGVAVGIAMSANYIYIRYALKKVRAIGEQGLEHNEQEKILTRVGGTSLISASFGLLLFGSMIMIAISQHSTPQLPKCSNAAVQQTAGKVVRQMLADHGVDGDSLEVRTFEDLEHEANEKRLCSFVVADVNEQVTFYMKVVWDQESAPVKDKFRVFVAAELEDLN